MIRRPKFFMEKRSEWNLGDTILLRETKQPYKIYHIETQLNDFGMIYSMGLNEDGNIGLSPTKYVVYPLLYMDKYFINLGNSKYWKVLYGTKSKDDTNVLSSKSK